MPPVRGVEKDIEQALKQGIEARLTADALTATVDTLTLGATGDEAVNPRIVIICEPAEYRGPNTGQYEANCAIMIQTDHTTGNDRDATGLADLVEAVGYCMDLNDFDGYALSLASINVRRVRGDHEIQDSHNETTIYLEVKACG